MRELAKQYRAVQQARMGLDLQRQAYNRLHPDGPGAIIFAGSVGEIERLKIGEKLLVKQIVALGKKTCLHSLVEKNGNGLGPHLYLCAALMPFPPEQAHSVAAYWKAAGAHPHGRPQRGKKLDYAPWRYGMWFGHVGAPLMKNLDSPYHILYEEYKTRKPLPKKTCPTCKQAAGQVKEERALKANTRERTGIGMDCANLGGPHWSKGHRHMAAIRFMLKAVMRDVVRTAKGQIALENRQNDVATGASTSRSTLRRRSA